jgi:hypothetical protein
MWALMDGRIRIKKTKNRVEPSTDGTRDKIKESQPINYTVLFRDEQTNCAQTCSMEDGEY